MPIVTLTSDFGSQDYYLPMLKGAILTQASDIQIIDISHNIKTYDIVQAAYIFKNAWKSFPKGSIHLISVNNFYQASCEYLLYESDGHYFIAPNNGLFSLIFSDLPEQAYLLPPPTQDASFPLIECYAIGIGKIAKGTPIEEIGEQSANILERITLSPVISPNQLKGSIIHIDHYGNAIVNIHKQLFEEIRNGRAFQLFFKRHDAITNLHTNYQEVGVGELLCLFNHAGYLEIAVNMGKASTLFGLELEDTIQIDFSSASKHSK